VSAVRLAAQGVFEPTPLFQPDRAVTVTEAVRGIFLTAGRNVGGLSDNELMSASVRSLLLEQGVFGSLSGNITRKQLCYLADRACLDGANMEQYSMLVPEYNSLAAPFQKAVVQAVGLGIVDYDEPGLLDDTVSRAELAKVLYRLSNPGARVVVPYDLGTGYDPVQNEYLVKNSFADNPGGIMFGFYSNYNHQDKTFTHFGKRAVDRTDFYKWALIEQSQGVYTMPSFRNDMSAHEAGSTVICNIDLSASYSVNSQLSGGSRIPSFYTQNIANPATRQAAKTFLNQFVISMLTAIHGDVWLSIDYELDYQQGITGTGSTALAKAEVFADWYEEAVAQARAAAASIGASDRLKLICIYNNITERHKLGKEQNEWMLRVSGASDLIGLDTYQFDAVDPSSPNTTLQNIRFLINNYSLGKPVFVVENGMDGIVGDSTSLTAQEMYWKNLFCEFRFSLEKGDFLNRNLSGFLAWSLFDTSIDTYKGLLTQNAAAAKPALAAVQEGIRLIEKQRQFAPSVLVSSIPAGANTQISVQSGTDYDRLTFVKKNYTGNGSATLRVELETAGTVMVTVNGKKHISDMNSTQFHFITIDSGLNIGFNYIDIYLGASQTPFTQTVKSVTLL